MTSFWYDRTCSVSRGGASVATGLPASIQQRKGIPYQDVSDVTQHDDWRILTDPAAGVTLQVRDMLTDDQGRTFRIVTLYPTPLGQQATASWGAWTNQAITIEAAKGRDDRGQVSGYAAAVSANVRLVTRQRKILRADGEEITSAAMLYFDGQQAIGIDDRLTWPDGTVRPILEVAQVPDQYGNTYTAVAVM